MMFHLPSYSGLTDEQDDILGLPLDSSALITGPPGTGKTIMAIYRAKLLHEIGQPTLLLMYGNLLSSYTGGAVKDLGIDGIVSTYHRWFPKAFSKIYGRQPPRLDHWSYDWNACKEEMLRRPLPEPEKRHIIVDEGQDMPPDFYFMLPLMSRSLTILADENQRVTQDQSTLEEILAATGITEVRSLVQNHRNTREIAQFAATFYTGKRSGIPTLPPAGHGTEAPSLQHHSNLHGTVTEIARYEQSRPDATIGVLLPYAKQVKSFYNRLDGKTRNPVEVYLSAAERGRLSLPDLSKPGVKIVSWASAKGRDFDTVFLPELQAVRTDPESEDLRMKLYVLASRARRQLSLMYSGEGRPPLVKALPLHLLRVLS
jgi:superfamily I DNA/RNA helicase